VRVGHLLLLYYELSVGLSHFIHRFGPHRALSLLDASTFSAVSFRGRLATLP